MPIRLNKLLISLLTGVLIFTCPLADAGKINQDKVLALKTAYVYNFIKYTQWPSDRFDQDDSPIQICLIGDEPIHRQLEELIKNKKVGNHPLVLHYTPFLSIDKSADNLSAELISALQQSDVIYFSCTLDDLAWEMISKLIAGQSKLTIGECEDCSGQLMMIRFVNKGDRIVFEVNLDEVEKVEMRLSSKLLVLATFVKKNGGSN